jgi:hypothetical protein
MVVSETSWQRTIENVCTTYADQYSDPENPVHRGITKAQDETFVGRVINCSLRKCKG